MKILSSKTLLVLITISFGLSVKSQTSSHYPGGVPGAEMWYMVDHHDLGSSTPIFQNHSLDYSYIVLRNCRPSWQNSFFNFNPSIYTDELCLRYDAPLENTISRNIFFVGEPKLPLPNENEEVYSHIFTEWNPALSSMTVTNTPVLNSFKFSNKHGLVNNSLLNYSSDNNANINFYSWNIYQLQNKLKSYGKKGETEFLIGKTYSMQGQQAANAEYFAGNFPEFISFPFELTYNQRSRVESYLALKYGITLNLNSSTAYRNSTNTVFWNNNNTLFWNRVFGVGRDDISGLNQLQSESVHFKDYLIASVGELLSSNIDSHRTEFIDNNHFIVFGDNGATDYLMDYNAFKVQPLKRKWLSQSTGENASITPVFFKISLEQVLKEAMTEDPALKLWMLHDKYVDNTEESDFNSQYVDYYEATSLDGLDYGFFEDVFFDTDENIFDQFTFGVGPKMIVQIRFDADCDDTTVRSHVVIWGGRAPYSVYIWNTGDYHEQFSINTNTMAFNAIAPDTYTVYVIDASGNEFEVEAEVELQQVDVDFGPDITLSQNLQEVTLEATQTDPDATYKWYFNGEIIEHFDPTLLATQPGIYKAEVTSGNHMCEDWDEIELSYNFTASAVPLTSCGEDTGSITLTLNGGVQPSFSVHIHNEEGPVPLDIFDVSNSQTINVDNVPFGENIVTITDGNGEQTVLNVDVVSPLNGIDIDLVTQLNSQCIPTQGPEYPLYMCPGATIDGSIGITNPNVSYEWFVNGQSTGIYDPEVEIYLGEGYPANVSVMEYELVVTNLDNGCSTSKKIGLQKGTYLRSTSTQAPQRMTQQEETIVDENTDLSVLETKVYPNPTEHSSTFYYEISSNKVFTGTVEIFSATGAIIHQQNINGKSSYKLPLMLLSSGNYLIRSTTSEGTVNNQIIIK